MFLTIKIKDKAIIALSFDDFIGCDSIVTCDLFLSRSRETVNCIFTVRSELRKVLFLVPSVCGFIYFVYEISQ